MTESIAATTNLRSVVLDIEVTNTASQGMAVRLGAERRAPIRVEEDRAGIERRLEVFVLMISR
jgi:RimJ/RimL family protein N-acetyltransferase